MAGKRVVTYEFNAWHQRGREEPDPGGPACWCWAIPYLWLRTKLDDTFVKGLQ